MAKELKEFKKFIQKYSKSFICILILAILTYSIKIFNYSISIDTEVTINNINSNDSFWIGIGRWMTVFLGKIFQHGKRFNPFLSNILIPIFLTVSVIIIGYTICKVLKKEKQNKLIFYTLGGLIVTSPAIAEMMNFTMMGAEVSFGMVLMALAVYLSYMAIYEKKRYLYIPTIIILISAMGTYQAIYPMYISIIAFIFLLDKIKNGMKRTLIEDIKIILKMLCVFMISFILCSMITSILVLIFDAQKSSYLDNQINWGRQPIKAVLVIVLGYIKSVVLPHHSAVWNKSYIFLSIGMVIYSIYLLRKEKQRAILPILCIGFLLVSPFLISILTGNAVAIRTMMNFPCVVATLFVLLISSIDKSKFLKYGVLLFIILFSCIQFKSTMDLFYSDYIRYEEDKNLVHSVFNKIDMSDELNGENRESTAIVFIGLYQPKSLGVVAKGDVMSYSFFEWDSNTDNLSNLRIHGFAQTLGYRYKLPTIEQINKAKTSWESLDIYPQKGFIKKIDDFILVRIA